MGRRRERARQQPGASVRLNALGLRTLAKQEIAAGREAHGQRRPAGATTRKTALTVARRPRAWRRTLPRRRPRRRSTPQTAFSGAIAAISPIPFVGPFLAPGIAAEMAALASAAGGYDIPAGVNPLTQLHAQEMVLPARQSGWP